MRDEELRQIIAKLENLSVRRQEIAKEESSLIRELQTLAGSATAPAARAAPTSSSSHSVSNKPAFSVGDQVFIENLGLVNVGRRSTRYGTVTAIKADKHGSERVYITRVNQPDTWRAPKNLRKLSAEESDDYNRVLSRVQL